MTTQKFFIGRMIGFFGILIILGAIWGVITFSNAIQRYPVRQKLPNKLQRATLSGTYTCLPRLNDETNTDACVRGIHTHDGVYYAVDFALMSQSMPNWRIGDQVTGSGVIVPVERLSLAEWREYPITGIFSITDTPRPNESTYKKLTYLVEGKNVTLVNGYSETDSVPNAESKTITRYFGNETLGDFNGDGYEDVAFLITQDTSGSGTFFYIVSALGGSNGMIGTNAIFLGDRIAPQTTEFRDGAIIVNYADRKSGEPMTASPSVGYTKYFLINNASLVEITADNRQQMIQNTSSADREACESSGGTWIVTLQPQGPGVCLQAVTDSGTVCTDNSQCEGYCAAPFAAKLGDYVVGHCEQYAGDCNQEVKNGIAQPVQCQ